MHPSAVHTAAGEPFAPVTFISTKLPAGTATLPVAVHRPPAATAQTNGVSSIVPGVAPSRSRT